MNSKGILLPNFLSLVLTVAGLVIFALALYKLYEFSVNQESENAKHLLTSIVEKVNALPSETHTSFSFQGFSENRWFLLGWNATDSSKPDRCGLSQTKGCLCICKDEGTPEACQEKGVCQLMSEASVFVHSSPVSFTVSYATGAPGPVGAQGIIHRECIVLPSNLFEIKFVRDSSGFALFYDFGSISFTETSEVFNRLSSCQSRLSQDSSHPL